MAEKEVTKYRKDKEAEFEKMKAEVEPTLLRKPTKDSRKNSTGRLRSRFRRSSLTMPKIRIRLSICW